MIYGGFQPIVAFGTAIAFMLASTWFHNQFKGRLDGLWSREPPFLFGQAGVTSDCSSPLSNISIMISEPPTNSPFT